MNAQTIAEICAPFGSMLMSRIPEHFLYRINQAETMPGLCRQLVQQGFTLLSMVASDESSLEDGVFKLYIVLVHTVDDLFLTLEMPLAEGETSYPALSSELPSAEPFEQEIFDLMGLHALGHPHLLKDSMIRRGLPDDFYPLRRNSHSFSVESKPGAIHTSPAPVKEPLKGTVLVSVGPIHAGVIEPGRFRFQTYGETVKELEINLGYTHKGIEALMQAGFGLEDGWRLAEQISADSSFAHSLAFCRAVESLVSPSIPLSTEYWRGIFLEMERISNHINDSAALAQDVAMEMVASELAVLRELIMQTCQNLAGHRLLRGLNRPGGLSFAARQSSPGAKDLNELRHFLKGISTAYIDLAYILIDHNGFRERLMGIGVLTQQQAEKLGMYGFVARASGVKIDFRLEHPQGIYRHAKVRQILEEDISGLPLLLSKFTPQGDALSRFALRAREVALSCQIIDHLAALLIARPPNEPLSVSLPLNTVPSYEFGFGYAEGWRGPVTAWIMKEKFNRIFRYKSTDPSRINWAGLKAAVEPHLVAGRLVETYLADFPLINKSFNLSYSGSDL